MPVETGDIAPDFSLVDQNGATHRLKDYAGKKVVLYFYPKDDTPGCTTEACSFRDSMPTVAGKNAVVLGVSGDSVNSHRKFADKYELPFPLLSDPDKAVLQAYDVWQEKTNYGKKSMGVVRSTFLVNPEGRIEKVWRNVKVDGHSEDVLSAID